MVQVNCPVEGGSLLLTLQIAGDNLKYNRVERKVLDDSPNQAFFFLPDE